MHKPRKSHLDIAFRILKYLKGSPADGICINKSDYFNLKGFVDVEWEKCLSSIRFVTGYFVHISNSLVSWRSKKHAIVSRFSTESKYMALGS